MKKYFLFILFTAFIVSVKAQKSEKEPYMIKSLSNESVKDVQVETSGGSISVSGAGTGESRVEVYISGNNSRTELTKDEIKKRLDELYTLEISVANNKLLARARNKEKNMDWKRSLSISFRIFVSKNVSTDLATSGGSISISDLSGKQKFTTSGGSLNIERVEGNIGGTTSGGSIYVMDSKNEIELTTSGGSIEAKNCTGNIRLNTSGGSLDLDNLKGQIKATTSGGSIGGGNIEGELSTFTSGGSIRLTDLSCSVDAGTSGGTVDVTIKELGKYIKLGNSGGNISLQLPKNKGVNLDLSGNRIKTDHLENFTGKIDEDEIEGKLNGGGIPVTVKAGSGRIFLELK